MGEQKLAYEGSRLLTLLCNVYAVGLECGETGVGGPRSWQGTQQLQGPCGGYQNTQGAGLEQLPFLSTFHLF